MEIQRHPFALSIASGTLEASPLPISSLEVPIHYNPPMEQMIFN